ncbi:hypothetical protein EW145_g998 [Phellinidium pouzarii]|uniref:Glucose receptor Git3 N-terminal domain-containing protein n=1 Tax=Phellinidium pouzarii TaxID=167371 RepID=A0A4S4LG82_9AGAM|nr:hypothetical protein EW145_g998 [Phellinidium pouzarii]
MDHFALCRIGDIAVALSTLAIAAHTFCAIVLSWRPLRPRIISTLVLTSIWSTIIVIIVITIVTHKDNLTGYWGSTEYWCWITTRYEVQQYALDYVFMWTTSVDGIAMQMLFYPMVYTLTVLPIAIVRFRAFNNQYVPFVYTVIADVLFSCSGFFNVCLFRLTRPALLPRRESASTYPSPNAISFSLRSPVVDHHSSFIGRPSFVPERSQLGALPDDSEIYRFESRSYPDHDVHSLEASPTKLSPSFASFRSHA